MQRLAAVSLVMVVMACGEHAAPIAPTAPTAPTAPIVTNAPRPAIAPIVPDAPPNTPPTPVAPPAREPGYDFIADVEVLYRVVACGHPDAPLPELLTHGDPARAAKLQPIVARHCKELRLHMDAYRTAYFQKARAWFVAHQPASLPSTVVYAFGGGDLVSALVAFPDATEITTLSLEQSGDPRKIATLAPAELDRALVAFRRDIGALIWVGSNLSVNLSAQQQSAVAAQLSSHLLGLSTGGYEPVSARYFSLDDDGAIHYLEQAEIDADQTRARSLSGSWKPPAFAPSFANVEIRYRVIGDPAIRVHRHIGWNLGDAYLKAHPGVLRHLERKGKVAVCVKGASYLLWYDDFARFRTYLIDHLAWMVADSTGLAPNYLTSTGLLQEAYGRFEGPVLAKMAGLRGDVASQKLWAKPAGPMPFRFGYLDVHDHNHVVITHPK